jgi:ribosomal protein S26
MSKTRGRERNVICCQCGRAARRDKAIVIEKMAFSNPLDRKDVEKPDEYSRGTFREMWYCPSCGKHSRIYEKKKKLMARQRERAALLDARRAAFRHRPRTPAEQKGEPLLDLTVHKEPAPEAQASLNTG